MRQLTALILISVLFAGCATSGSRWEMAAVGASLADLGSTGGAVEQGMKEQNPLYGSNPSSGQMIAINAVILAGVWYLTRNMEDDARQKVWRNVAVIRMAAAAWNLSQSGGGFKLSF
ncbi:MAG TPA: hypothetical protein VEW48_24255 [Thermoanaerobaculia bacterium]|nr:hypothetical protein [Thermoanaerobaculia bacterium]